eukprot:CAMPEP_0179100322 /NCGR_PEP_ID=MMETSP0796-20121207/46324_1 /TAXON_ID=73915 /ORGANISM="Pyrodinium bahamense, Strain pbaha01" /LENGTH=327 /DNA_ID=CAMNT_0020798137 /DNA_START=14 /DNA_END=997 /DNA_ORIENTATION=+
MGAAIEKNLVFPAPQQMSSSANLVWDEQPRATPGGGVARPFLWIRTFEDTSLTLIHFHANAEDLDLVEGHLRRLSAELSANVLGVEYPGYGQLQGPGPDAKGLGTPTITGIDAAAAHALQFVVLTHGIRPSEVLLHGRSLGCGPALRLARRARDHFQWSLAGLILQSPFISVKQLAFDFVGTAGSLLVPECYDNLEELRLLCCTQPPVNHVHRWTPILIVHGKQDRIVQRYHSAVLYNAAQHHGHSAVEVTFPEKASHDSWDVHTDLALPILEFLRRHPGPRVKDTKAARTHLGCARVMGCTGRGGQDAVVDENTQLAGLGSLVSGF